jgi:nucleoid-associated protein EbfC
MFDIAKMMKQAQEVQKRMGSIQEKLADLIVVGEDSKKRVQVKFNGKFEPLGVTCLVDSLSKEEVEEAFMGALNDAMQQIMRVTETEMQELTKGINIPGLKLPF